MTDHSWPRDESEHLFGKWLTLDKKTKYRICVHPQCNVTEKKDVSKV